MKKNILSTIGITSIFLVLMLVPANIALAFSGYGDGSSAKPYRIGSCAQLQEINNNLSGNYVLVSNINCSGVSFTHLADSTSFTGTLDGANHTISNLNVDNWGLFDLTNGATIKNLNISSGSITSSTSFTQLGSVVGQATNTTLSNVHSNMTLSSPTYGAIGGIVGALYGGSITGSSFTGSISDSTTDVYLGGLVGFLNTSSTSTTVSNDFTTGSITGVSGDNYIAGISSGAFEGTISNVYSIMTLNAPSSNYTAGIAGYFSGTAINNSFSAVTFNATGLDIAAVIGVNSTSLSNDYFDETATGTNICGGTGGSCNGVNASSSQPNYFKDNGSNAPFTSWDFNNIWETTSGYPTLRDISNFSDPAGLPNNGDANGDGIQDSYEPNVASTEESNGVWATVTVPSFTNCNLGNTQSSQNSSSYTSRLAITNLTSFDIYCPTSGMTVPATIIYSKLLETENANLTYYNPSTKSYSTVPGATFSTVNIGGKNVTEVTYNITDGGSLDEDGTSNGVIVDPVFVTSPMTTVSAPDTGFGSNNLSLKTALPIFAVSTLFGTALLTRRKIFSKR